LAETSLQSSVRAVNHTGKAVSWTVWVGIALVAATLALALVLWKLQSIRAMRTAVPELPVIAQVADFKLTNHLDQPMTLDNLKGRVWVADIIFTRCAGPCPVMTHHLRELQDALPASSKAHLVTLTTDADNDTSSVLKKYAEKFGANAGRWDFLTGDKRAIANLAIDSLKLTAIAKKPEERTDDADLFVHSTIFVIVDKKGQLRGSFQTQGEMVEWPETKQQILATIAKLESEP